MITNIPILTSQQCDKLLEECKHLMVMGGFALVLPLENMIVTKTDFPRISLPINAIVKLNLADEICVFYTFSPKHMLVLLG